MKITEILCEANADWKGCLMLSMPKWLSDEIHNWSLTNIREEALVNSGRETYSHLTILYGFPQDVGLSQVRDAIDSLPDKSIMTVELGPIKRFTNDEFDVLVIEAIPEQSIKTMHYFLKDKFSVESIYPTYNPHITIAYVAPGTHTDLDGLIPWSARSVACDQMVFSTGPSGDRTVRPIAFKTFLAHEKEN